MAILASNLDLGLFGPSGNYNLAVTWPFWFQIGLKRLQKALKGAKKAAKGTKRLQKTKMALRLVTGQKPWGLG